MKILNRSQVTEVTTRRTVFHSLEHEGEKYSRMLDLKSVVPYMDEKVVTTSGTPKWLKVTANAVLVTIPKSKALELEALYQEQPLQERNGN